MLASSKKICQVFDNPLQAVQTTIFRGLGQLRKSVSKDLCMDPVAKGWLRSSTALWERLQGAPRNILLGTAAREFIRMAQSRSQRNVAWAGRFMLMLHMITGQGARDDAATVHILSDIVGMVPQPIVFCPSQVE